MAVEKTAPTLFVGLGGTGSDIVKRVARKVSEQERRNVAFAVLDTDINDLRKIEKEYPFIKTIQTSQGRTVGEFLEYDKRAKEEWFPTNPILNKKPLTEGAGQVRAISRLAFEMTLREGRMRPLHDAIESLYRLDENYHEQALRVTVVSSLCGGTGSGIILPIGLYLRSYLEKAFRVKDLIIRGFFLLPEVFYDVCRGADEKEALRANAYATLRELDTFIMRGISKDDRKTDNYLPERYKNVKALEFELPADGIEGRYEDYNVLPYDFCFLFDGKNRRRLSLNNHNQYRDHAANCIYAQSIGATGPKSNSNEDNKIRELMIGQGRNRYAGAGCSSLIYPCDDVQAYISLRWTQQKLSNNWMKYDYAFRKKQQDTEELRNRGVQVGDDDRCQHYIDTVDTYAKGGDAFSNSIIRQCYNFDEYGKQTTGRWEAFIDELKNHVADISNDETLNELRDQADKKIKELPNARLEIYNKIQEVFNKQIEGYRTSVEQFCQEKSRTIALNVFDKTTENITGSGAKHCLETYMRDGDRKFDSPNAARYFLYQLKKAMKSEYEELNGKQKEAVDKLSQMRDGDKTKGGEGNIFDFPETEAVETIKDLPSRINALSKFGKLKVRFGNSLPEMSLKLLDDFDEYMDMIKQYRENSIIAEVLRAGLDYVEKMIGAFEDFFDSFDYRLKQIEWERKEIIKKYELARGSTIHYVCASEACLEAMVKDFMTTGGSTIGVDPNMSESIYKRVRTFAFQRESSSGFVDARKREKEITEAFEAIFYKGIVEYYKNELMSKYGSQIDINILDAIEREEALGIKTEGQGDTAIERAFNTARQLAEPFIESVMGAANEPISLCAYHPYIMPKDESERAHTIRTALVDGVQSERISIYQIDFYKGVYCLQANQLSKFRPDLPGQIAGEYFKSYYGRVNRLSPRSVDSKEVTPHIDRRWHIVTNMPDLDETYQEEQIRRIYKAFFDGFVYGLFDYKAVGKNRHEYRICLPDTEPEELVVSNGTPCDLLYEVLDALTWTPSFVTKILEVAEDKVEKELVSTSRLKFGSSYLHARIHGDVENMGSVEPLRITEYERVDGREVVLFDVPDVTLFDLVSLLKISMPAADFDYKIGKQIVEAAMEEIYAYVARLTTKDEIDDVFAGFMLDQLKHFAKHSDVYDDSFANYIGTIVKVVMTKLEEIDQGHVSVSLREEAKKHQWL